jgi:hypothetical protein
LSCVAIVHFSPCIVVVCLLRCCIFTPSCHVQVLELGM